MAGKVVEDEGAVVVRGGHSPDPGARAMTSARSPQRPQAIQLSAYHLHCRMETRVPGARKEAPHFGAPLRSGGTRSRTWWMSPAQGIARCPSGEPCHLPFVNPIRRPVGARSPPLHARPRGPAERQDRAREPRSADRDRRCPERVGGEASTPSRPDIGTSDPLPGTPPTLEGGGDGGHARARASQAGGG